MNSVEPCFAILNGTLWQRRIQRQARGAALAYLHHQESQDRTPAFWQWTECEFGVGDCFGEAALLSMINNTASFVAAEDCELIVLSRRALSRLRVENLELFSLLILNMARELARTVQFTDEMLIRMGPGVGR